MPETPPMVDDDLRADLAAYFALTTATELPASAARMDSTTLRARRRSWWPGAAKPAMALLGAAAVVVGGIALSRGHLGGGTVASQTALSSAPDLSRAGSGGPAAAGQSPVPASGALITYPGVDAAVVRTALGIGMFEATGHGSAVVSAEQARSTAVAAFTGSEGAGVAVLSWVVFASPASPSTCLCWVIDVLVAPPAVQPVVGSTGARSVLILVDSRTGAVVTGAAGPGIP